jgi:hypothetical protein
LVAAEDVERDAPRLQAATARQIVQWVQQEFYQTGQAESRLLLTFCLYWWAAFSLNYTFEVEIFRDLRAAGVEFACHDITNRAERLSAFDLTVMGMCGDVKYSTYFLTLEEARTTEVDFFITRLYNEVNGRWLRVVFLIPAAWAAIDGETTKTGRRVCCRIRQRKEVNPMADKTITNMNDEEFDALEGWLAVKLRCLHSRE